VKKETRFLIGLIILLLILAVAACQTEQPNPDGCPLDVSSGEDDAGCPPEERETASEAAAYPLDADDDPFDNEALAYPITEADLASLMQRWRLTTYAEDGIESAPPAMMLMISADGSYTITTDNDIVTGTWMSILQAREPSLVFDPETGYDQYYQIIKLDSAELNLRTWRDGVQIDEEYRPDD
jgi:hypothetical protein